MSRHLPHQFIQRRQFTSLRKERGVAMITALMLSAIAITLVASIFVQQRYTIRLTSNFQDLEQTYQYAYAAEDLVGVLLKRDLKNGENDSEFDNWGSKNFEPFEIDDDDGEQIGLMTIEIEDMQGRFNVNNLVRKSPAQQNSQNANQTGSQSTTQQNASRAPDQPRQELVKAFGKLLNQKGLPANFSQAVVDWIDAGDDQVPNGAEKDYYLSLDPPYEAANAFLSDTADLLRIKMEGVDDTEKQDEQLSEVMPFITALPTPTAVNVNTASKEVLMAMGVSGNMADGMINWRKSQEIDSNTLNQQFGRSLSEATKSLLDVKSNYFRLAGEVKLGKSRVFLSSLLFRSPSGEVHVILRQFSRVPKPKPEDQASNALTG